MASQFTTENVEQAVLQFYYNTNIQQEVHKWLTAAQVSPEAWSFCIELLSEQKSGEVQFFGASTLHAKISRYWHEVPVEQYDSLRAKLLEKILQFSSGPKMVFTRLCVALSSFLLRSAPEHWPDPIQNLITTFQQENIQNNNMVQRCKILLEILKLIPEEFFSTNLTHKRRVTLRIELQKGLGLILPIIRGLLSPSTPSDIYNQSLRTFSSWVEFGIPMNDGEEIIHHVFQALHNPDLFETAVDTLVSVFSHPDSHRFPYTIQKLLPQLHLLQEMFQKAIDDLDIEKSHGLCRIIVTIAENHTKLITESALSDDEAHRNNAMHLVKMVLGCSSLPGHFPVDEGCSDQTFTFWYILQDELVANDAPRSNQLMMIFQPVYFSLMEVLLVKVQYPEDSEYESWTADEQEQFRCYRQDVGDTMMYAFNILREPLLGYLCGVLNRIVESSGAQNNWQMIEAIFFLFGSVAESVALEEGQHLPSLLKLLPRIPFINNKLISTALYMIGCFGEWMNYHPESLCCVIPLLLQGLGNSEVATAATMALKDVSRENLDHMQPFAYQILSASQSVLESNALKGRDNLRLMSCVGQVLTVLPFNEIMQYLDRILSSHIQQLQQLATEEPSAAIKPALQLKIDLISWLFASLDTEREPAEDEGVESSPVKPSNDGPKPVFVVLQKITPILHAVVTKWVAETTIIESVCALFKRALRTLMDDFLPLAPDVIQMTCQMYEIVPQSPVLDLGRQMILMFAADQSQAHLIKVLLSTICVKTVKLCQTAPRENTDIIESFMTLLAQVLKKVKHMLLEEGFNLNELFQAGLMAMTLPEHHTVRSACSFLCEFLQAGLETQAMKQVIVDNGLHLVDRVLQAIGGNSPRGVIEHIADIILYLNKHHFEYLSQWLPAMMEREGYPSAQASKQDKEQFVKNILRERVNKRKIRDIVKEFTLLCRGLFGTEYVAQAAAQL
ncbi:importin-13 [Patella vulgata]|uniref:importin-13 n=1 Tax=Patella vulgata TaxID=6465 RepID=UPI00217F8711|nr:importin-13 [Patella vulgata]